jgi:hypothetical protein
VSNPLRPARFTSRAGALVVALVPLAVYILTLQNGLTPGELSGGDPITHQYAQATLRFSNAPGYPIFSALGWVWFELSALLTPFFNPIERLTFYSTLYAIPSLVVLYYLIIEVLEARDGGQVTGGKEQGASHKSPTENFNSLIAIFATLFFAFTYFFWYYAISSENYSSGTLNTLVMLVLALRWQQRRDEGTLLWLAFVCGLSLAHLLTVALAVPAVLVFVVGQESGYLRRPKLLVKIAAATFLPLLSYAYVFWRGAEHPEWRGQGNWPSTWAWFFDFVRTQQGQTELTWNWDGIPWDMLRLMANELTPLVFVGGLLGLLLLPWWRELPELAHSGAGQQKYPARWRTILFMGILAVYVPEMYLDRYGNWFQTVIALYPVFVIGLALLVQRVAALVSARPPARFVNAALVLLLAGLALNRLLSNYASDNLRDRPNATGLNPGWLLLADEPESGARIAGVFEEDLALDYLTQIWGAQPPVKVVSLNQVNALPGQPLYASRAAMPIVLKSLSPGTHLSAQGLNLVALRAEPSAAVPAAAQISPRTLGHGLELAGQTVRKERNTQHLSLFWRAAQHIDVDMSMSVRLMRADQVVAQVDSAAPVGGFYPMTRWQPGEVVRDDYALPLDPPSAADRLHIILYQALPAGFENLAEWDVAVNK